MRGLGADFTAEATPGWDAVAAMASGHLPAGVHTAVPLEKVAVAYRVVAKGGVRGTYVLQP